MVGRIVSADVVKAVVSLSIGSMVDGAMKRDRDTQGKLAAGKSDRPEAGT
jgi:hypothetical protein